MRLDTIFMLSTYIFSSVDALSRKDHVADLLKNIPQSNQLYVAKSYYSIFVTYQYFLLDIFIATPVLHHS